MQTTYPATNIVTPNRTGAKTAPKKARAASQTQPGAKPVELRLTMPEAISVAVAGTFNDWDPGRNPMRKESAGAWKTTLTLAPGIHEYRFVVDGDWISDPTAMETVENPFGQTNSVIRV
jgi:1,4-alpha-glucan branching enzyme